MKIRTETFKKWASENVAKVIVTTVVVLSAGWLANHYDDALKLMIDNSILTGAMLLFAFALGMFVAFQTGFAEAYALKKRDESEHLWLMKTRYMELNPAQRKVLMKAYEVESTGSVYQVEASKSVVERTMEQDGVLISAGDHNGFEYYRISAGWRAVAQIAIEKGYGLSE